MATFLETPSGQGKIVLDDGDREVLEARRDDNDRDVLVDLLEDELCNSDLMVVNPEWVGALTERLIFTRNGCRGDRGEFEWDGPPVCWVTHEVDEYVHGLTATLLRDGCLNLERVE